MTVTSRRKDFLNLSEDGTRCWSSMMCKHGQQKKQYTVSTPTPPLWLDALKTFGHRGRFRGSWLCYQNRKVKTSLLFLKFIQWLSTEFKIKSRLLSIVYNVLHDLASPVFRLHLSTFWRAPKSLVNFLTPLYTKLVPTTETLHLLVPLSPHLEYSFPRYSHVNFFL